MRWVNLVIVTILVGVFALADKVHRCFDNQMPSPKILTTRFTYKAVVPEILERGEILRLWLPVPSDSKWQVVRDMQVNSTYLYRITQEKKFGNRMVYFCVKRPQTPVTVTVSFIVERKEVRVLESDRQVFKTAMHPSNCNHPHCQQNRNLVQISLGPETLVPVGGRFLTIANEVVRGKNKTIDKIRTLYEHVVSTIQYDYRHESPKLGQGDALFVCDFRKGNCSDLHSYLISLARSLGIPAYLEYGFPISGIPIPEPLPKEGKLIGYHCWTWVYDERFGWFPVDASDGRRWLDAGKSEVKDLLFGNLILERSAVAFSRGRDIILNPPQKSKSLNYFIYPYAEIDGQPVKVDWDLTYQLLP